MERAEIAEIEAAFRGVRERGIPIIEVGKHNFPLPRFERQALRLLAEALDCDGAVWGWGRRGRCKRRSDWRRNRSRGRWCWLGGRWRRGGGGRAGGGVAFGRTQPRLQP